MDTISSLLQATSHRPYPIPEGSWKYYHEWNGIIFYHWPIDADIIKPLLPSGLELDTINNQAWISLVAFGIKNIRPRFLPSFPPISNFHEINIRTYVAKNKNPGIYFLSVQGQKRVSVFLANLLTGVPYRKSTIIPKPNGYKCINKANNFYLDTNYEVKDFIKNKTELDKWLTERYRVYVDIAEKMYTFDIHHREWELKKLEITNLNLIHATGNLLLDGKMPTLTHYSDDLEVVMWGRQQV